MFAAQEIRVAPASACHNKRTRCVKSATVVQLMSPEYLQLGLES